MMLEQIITFIVFVLIVYLWLKQGGLSLSLKQTTKFFTVILSIVTILAFGVSLVSVFVRGDF